MSSLSFQGHRECPVLLLVSGLFTWIPSFHLLNASDFFKDMYMTPNESWKIKCNSLVDKTMWRWWLPNFLHFYGNAVWVTCIFWLMPWISSYPYRYENLYWNTARSMNTFSPTTDLQCHPCKGGSFLLSWAIILHFKCS